MRRSGLTREGHRGHDNEASFHAHHEGYRGMAEILPQEAGDGNDEAFVA